jgi:tetratricopeptide (TPR) repeat protein
MAETALTEGMLELAEEYARGAARASAGDATALAEANSFLGQFALDQGRTETGSRSDDLYDTAETYYRRAAELFDTGQQPRAVARVLASLGRLLLERGRYADAVAELRSAVERLRGDVDVRLAYAGALRSSGQIQAAFGEYTTVIASAPDEARHERVEALIERGKISVERSDATTGLRDLEDAIRLEPEVTTRSDVIAARAQAIAVVQRHA